MGISGLLPLLKSVQRQRHLSEFAGQTVAVDAYVWLHRGAYGCATELALGKPTHKYVDYAMHRVRLLRHYGITPYIVFDGGPLPAKQGTEESRETKRKENLARGKALAAQGQHTRARECFCKCVDVTPQMAFQLIKALRVEDVPYVVAPYEADAQMAFLEATGVVSAILTEDSDLLVFGARTVLLKLDTTAASVTSISHSELGAALPGWTHARFRAMAILSGCDYLPSLPGVGLKTAKTWLAAHGTVEKSLAAARMAGKTRVPQGYLEKFNRAEAVFLHQRVYDPSHECLVHLSPPPRGVEFDTETDAYIGSDIDAHLAARIARGDACPISLRAMVDINPGYTPRPIGMPKPLAMTDVNSKTAYSYKGKGPVTATTPRNGGITRFLVPAKTLDRTGQAGPSNLPPPAVGARSGKRTLAALADDDAAAARVRTSPSTTKRSKVTHSRFFPPPERPRTPVSPRKPGPGKENTPVRRQRGSHSSEPDLHDANEDEIDNITTLSMLPLAPRSPRALPTPSPSSTPEDHNAPWESLPDPGSMAVIQEDGYLSPPPTMSDDEGDELSSPVRPRIRNAFAEDVLEDEDETGIGEGWVRTLDLTAFRYEPPGSAHQKCLQDEEDLADVLSSPPRSRPPPQANGAILVPASPAGDGACSDIEDADESPDGLHDVPIASYENDEDPFEYSDSAPERDLSDGLLDDPWLVDYRSTPEPHINAKAVGEAWRRKYSLRPGKPDKAHAPLSPLRRRHAFV